MRMSDRTNRNSQSPTRGAQARGKARIRRNLVSAAVLTLMAALILANIIGYSDPLGENFVNAADTASFNNIVNTNIGMHPQWIQGKCLSVEQGGVGDSYTDDHTVWHVDVEDNDPIMEQSPAYTYTGDEGVSDELISKYNLKKGNEVVFNIEDMDTAAKVWADAVAFAQSLGPATALGDSSLAGTSPTTDCVGGGNENHAGFRVGSNIGTTNANGVNNGTRNMYQGNFFIPNEGAGLGQYITVRLQTDWIAKSITTNLPTGTQAVAGTDYVTVTGTGSSITSTTFNYILKTKQSTNDNYLSTDLTGYNRMQTNGDYALSYDIASNSFDYDGGNRPVFNDNCAFSYGRINVPTGVYIVLDLNGHTIDRALTGTNGDYFGSVFHISSKSRLEVCDTSAYENASSLRIQRYKKASSGLTIAGHEGYWELIPAEDMSTTPDLIITNHQGMITGGKINTAQGANALPDALKPDMQYRGAGFNLSMWADLVIHSGTIYGNENDSESGGAFYQRSKAAVTIFDGYVLHNTAHKGGGVSTLGGGSGCPFTMYGGVLGYNKALSIGSSASNGGAIALGVCSYANFHGGEIIYNHATGTGGALNVSGNTLGILDSVTIMGNVADTNGGGVFVSSHVAAVDELVRVPNGQGRAFKFRGSLQVYGNKCKGIEQNVFLEYGENGRFDMSGAAGGVYVAAYTGQPTIAIGGPLFKNGIVAHIGVTLGSVDTVTTTGSQRQDCTIFTSDYDEYNSGVNAFNYFFSDKATYSGMASARVVNSAANASTAGNEGKIGNNTDAEQTLTWIIKGTGITKTKDDQDITITADTVGGGNYGGESGIVYTYSGLTCEFGMLKVTSVEARIGGASGTLVGQWKIDNTSLTNSFKANFKFKLGTEDIENTGKVGDPDGSENILHVGDKMFDVITATDKSISYAGEYSFLVLGDARYKNPNFKIRINQTGVEVDRQLYYNGKNVTELDWTQNIDWDGDGIKDDYARHIYETNQPYFIYSGGYYYPILSADYNHSAMLHLTNPFDGTTSVVPKTSFTGYVLDFTYANTAYFGTSTTETYPDGRTYKGKEVNFGSHTGGGIEYRTMHRAPGAAMGIGTYVPGVMHAGTYQVSFISSRNAASSGETNEDFDKTGVYFAANNFAFSSAVNIYVAPTGAEVRLTDAAQADFTFRGTTFSNEDVVLFDNTSNTGVNPHIDSTANMVYYNFGALKYEAGIYDIRTGLYYTMAQVRDWDNVRPLGRVAPVDMETQEDADKRQQDAANAKGVPFISTLQDSDLDDAPVVTWDKTYSGTILDGATFNSAASTYDTLDPATNADLVSQFEELYQRPLHMESTGKLVYIIDAAKSFTQDPNDGNPINADRYVVLVMLDLDVGYDDYDYEFDQDEQHLVGLAGDSAYFWAFEFTVNPAEINPYEGVRTGDKNTLVTITKEVNFNARNYAAAAGEDKKALFENGVAKADAKHVQANIPTVNYMAQSDFQLVAGVDYDVEFLDGYDYTNASVNYGEGATALNYSTARNLPVKLTFKGNFVNNEHDGAVPEDNAKKPVAKADGAADPIETTDGAFYVYFNIKPVKVTVTANITRTYDKLEQDVGTFNDADGYSALINVSAGEAGQSGKYMLDSTTVTYDVADYALPAGATLEVWVYALKTKVDVSNYQLKTAKYTLGDGNSANITDETGVVWQFGYSSSVEEPTVSNCEWLYGSYDAEKNVFGEKLGEYAGAAVSDFIPNFVIDEAGSSINETISAKNIKGEVGMVTKADTETYAHMSAPDDTTLSDDGELGLEYTYAGESWEYRPAITLKYAPYYDQDTDKVFYNYSNLIVLQQRSDYSLNYVANVHAGTASVQVSGLGNYTGMLTLTFTITPAQLTARFEDVSPVYNTQEQPVTIEYKNVSNYDGAPLYNSNPEAKFDENPVPSPAAIHVTYNGSESRPVNANNYEVKVALDGANYNFTTGKAGGYVYLNPDDDPTKATSAKEYIIKPKNISDGPGGVSKPADILTPEGSTYTDAQLKLTGGYSATNVYTGAAVNLLMTLSYHPEALPDGRTLGRNTDYELSYQYKAPGSTGGFTDIAADQAVDVGTYRVTITAKEPGNYTGSFVVDIEITPAQISVSLENYSGAAITYDGNPHQLNVIFKSDTTSSSIVPVAVDAARLNGTYNTIYQRINSNDETSVASDSEFTLNYAFSNEVLAGLGHRDWHNKFTNAGNYTVTVELAENGNFVFAGGVYTSGALTYKIDPATIQVRDLGSAFYARQGIDPFVDSVSGADVNVFYNPTGVVVPALEHVGKTYTALGWIQPKLMAQTSLPNGLPYSADMYDVTLTLQNSFDGEESDWYADAVNFKFEVNTYVEQKANKIDWGEGTQTLDFSKLETVSNETRKQSGGGISLDTPFLVKRLPINVAQTVSSNLYNDRNHLINKNDTATELLTGLMGQMTITSDQALDSSDLGYILTIVKANSDGANDGYTITINFGGVYHYDTSQGGATGRWTAASYSIDFNDGSPEISLTGTPDENGVIALLEQLRGVLDKPELRDKLDKPENKLLTNAGTYNITFSLSTANFSITDASNDVYNIQKDFTYDITPVQIRHTGFATVTFNNAQQPVTFDNNSFEAIGGGAFDGPRLLEYLIGDISEYPQPDGDSAWKYNDLRLEYDVSSSGSKDEWLNGGNPFNAGTYTVKMTLLSGNFAFISANGISLDEAIAAADGYILTNTAYYVVNPYDISDGGLLFLFPNAIYDSMAWEPMPLKADGEHWFASKEGYENLVDYTPIWEKDPKVSGTGRYDYTLAYFNNTYAYVHQDGDYSGAPTVTVTGSGNLTGSYNYYFNIYPRKLNLTLSVQSSIYGDDIVVNSMRENAFSWDSKTTNTYNVDTTEHWTSAEMGQDLLDRITAAKKNDIASSDVINLTIELHYHDPKTNKWVRYGDEGRPVLNAGNYRLCVTQESVDKNPNYRLGFLNEDPSDGWYYAETPFDTEGYANKDNPGCYTVIPRTLNINVNRDLFSYVYGTDITLSGRDYLLDDKNAADWATITSSNSVNGRTLVVEGDVLSFTLSVKEGGPKKGSPVGTYSDKIDFAGQTDRKDEFANENYTPIFNENVITITKRPLTVTVKPQSHEYNNREPVIKEPNYQGDNWKSEMETYFTFEPVNKEGTTGLYTDESGVVHYPKIDLDIFNRDSYTKWNATVYNFVGYPIEEYEDTLNYSINFLGTSVRGYEYGGAAEFTITPRPIKITPTPKNYYYYDGLNPDPAGERNDNWKNTDYTDAYNGSVEGETMGRLHEKVDDPDSPLEDPHIQLMKAAGVDAGDYDILCQRVVGDWYNNYDVTIDPESTSKFTINPRVIYIRIKDDLTSVYGTYNYVARGSALKVGSALLNTYNEVWEYDNAPANPVKGFSAATNDLLSDVNYLAFYLGVLRNDSTDAAADGTAENLARWASVGKYPIVGGWAVNLDPGNRIKKNYDVHFTGDWDDEASDPTIMKHLEESYTQGAGTYTITPADITWTGNDSRVGEFREEGVDELVLTSTDLRFAGDVTWDGHDGEVEITYEEPTFNGTEAEPQKSVSQFADPDDHPNTGSHYVPITEGVWTIVVNVTAANHNPFTVTLVLTISPQVITLTLSGDAYEVFYGEEGWDVIRNADGSFSITDKINEVLYQLLFTGYGGHKRFVSNVEWNKDGEPVSDWDSEDNLKFLKENLKFRLIPTSTAMGSTSSRLNVDDYRVALVPTGIAADLTTESERLTVLRVNPINLRFQYSAAYAPDKDDVIWKWNGNGYDQSREMHYDGKAHAISLTNYIGEYEKNGKLHSVELETAAGTDNVTASVSTYIKTGNTLYVPRVVGGYYSVVTGWSGSDRNNYKLDTNDEIHNRIDFEILPALVHIRIKNFEARYGDLQKESMAALTGKWEYVDKTELMSESDEFTNEEIVLNWYAQDTDYVGDTYLRAGEYAITGMYTGTNYTVRFVGEDDNHWEGERPFGYDEPNQAGKLTVTQRTVVIALKNITATYGDYYLGNESTPANTEWQVQLAGNQNDAFHGVALWDTVENKVDLNGTAVFQADNLYITLRIDVTSRDCAMPMEGFDASAYWYYLKATEEGASYPITAKCDNANYDIKFMSQESWDGIYTQIDPEHTTAKLTVQKKEMEYMLFGGSFEYGQVNLDNEFVGMFRREQPFAGDDLHVTSTLYHADGTPVSNELDSADRNRMGYLHAGLYAVVGSFENSNYTISFFGNWTAGGYFEAGEAGYVEIRQKEVDVIVLPSESVYGEDIIWLYEVEDWETAAVPGDVLENGFAQLGLSFKLENNDLKYPEVNPAGYYITYDREAAKNDNYIAFVKNDRQVLHKVTARYIDITLAGAQCEYGDIEDIGNHWVATNAISTYLNSAIALNGTVGTDEAIPDNLGVTWHIENYLSTISPVNSYRVEIRINNRNYVLYNPTGDDYEQYYSSEPFRVVPRRIQIGFTGALTSQYGDPLTIGSIDSLVLTRPAGLEGDAVVNGDSLDFGFNIPFNSRSDVGVYTFDVLYNNDPNYELLDWNALEYTITARKILVTLGDMEGEYGDEPAPATYTAVRQDDLPGDAVMEGDAMPFVIEIIGFDPHAVGSSFRVAGNAYDGSALIDPNYAIEFVDGKGSYTLTKRRVFVEVTGGSSEYGDPIGEIGWTAHHRTAEGAIDDSKPGFVNDDAYDFEFVTSAHIGDSIGTYNVEMSVNEYDEKLYDVVIDPVLNDKYEIVRRVVIIKVLKPMTAIYGSMPAAIGAEDLELKRSNDSSDVWYGDEYATIVPDPSELLSHGRLHAGRYEVPLEISFGNPDWEKNYDIRTDEVAYIIEPRPIEVELTGHRKVYDGEAISVGSEQDVDWRITSGEVLEGDTLGVSLAVPSTADAGQYVIAGDWDNNDYALTFKGDIEDVAKYYVDRRAITVTVLDKEKYYDRGAIYVGSVEGEDWTLTAGTMCAVPAGITLSVEAATDVDDYTIHGDYTNKNYDVTFILGTYHILQAKNRWVHEFSVFEMEEGETLYEEQIPTARFGNAVIEYFLDEACTRRFEGDIRDAKTGTYYVRVTVEGTKNYTELKDVYALRIIDSFLKTNANIDIAVYVLIFASQFVMLTLALIFCKRRKNKKQEAAA